MVRNKLRRDERTDEGPPTRSGVLNVVAILEHRPLRDRQEIGVTRQR